MHLEALVPLLQVSVCCVFNTRNNVIQKELSKDTLVSANNQQGSSVLNRGMFFSQSEKKQWKRKGAIIYPELIYISELKEVGSRLMCLCVQCLHWPWELPSDILLSSHLLVWAVYPSNPLQHHSLILVFKSSL